MSEGGVRTYVYCVHACSHGKVSITVIAPVALVICRESTTAGPVQKMCPARQQKQLNLKQKKCLPFIMYVSLSSCLSHSLSLPLRIDTLPNAACCTKQKKTCTNACNPALLLAARPCEERIHSQMATTAASQPARPLTRATNFLGEGNRSYIATIL